MRSRELRIVPADLTRGALRVIEEIEIVNGDEPDGMPGGEQQRVQRLRNIDVTGKGFDRGPLRPMPQKVQHVDRDAAVDDLGAGKGRG
jgi:hypothetical protein